MDGWMIAGEVGAVLAEPRYSLKIMMYAGIVRCYFMYIFISQSVKYVILYT